MLANEKYTGNALLMKRYRNNHLEKKQIKNNGELPMYYAEETHDAIISQEVFEKAQEVLKRMEEKTKGRPKPTQSELTGLIRCGNCGQNYCRRIAHGIAFWDCSNYARNGRKVCTGGRIHEDMLYELVSSVAPLDSIEKMSARDNIMTFYLNNGTTVKREWKLRSRSESWTPEMKEAASLRQRRNTKCQK